MGKGAIANRSYLRRVTEAAATKATNLYEMSKTYTPTKILAIEEHLEERLKGLEEKAQLLETSTQVISRIDQKLDSVAERVEGIMTSQHANAQRAGQVAVDSMAFVTSNVTKSFTRNDSCEESLAEADTQEEDADTQAMCDRFSSMLVNLSDKYQQCLVSVDQGVELWLPIQDPEATPEESTESVVTVSKLGAKTAKKLKLAAFDKLEKLEARSTKQIDDMVTVDLIQYASEQMDAVAGLARKAQTRVNDTKGLVETRVANAKELAQSKVAETVTRMNDAKSVVTTRVCDAIAPHKATCEANFNKVYVFAQGKWSLVADTPQYARLTVVYQQAMDQCRGLHDGSIASLAFLQEKTAVLFTDGAVALVDNLRSEGKMPEQGQASIQNLASLVVTLVKPEPAKAQELISSLYLQLLEASTKAPAQLQAQTHQLIGYCKQVDADAVKEFAAAKTREFLILAKASPEQAQALAVSLYSQLQELVIPPEWVQAVESFKAIAGVKWVAGIEIVELVKSRCGGLYSHVKQSVTGNDKVNYLASAVLASASEPNYLFKAVANAAEAAAQTSSARYSQLVAKLPSTSEITRAQVYEQAKSQWHRLYSTLSNLSAEQYNNALVSAEQLSVRVNDAKEYALSMANNARANLPDVDMQQIKATVEARWQSLYTNLAQQVASSTTYPKQLLQSAQSQWHSCEEAAKQRLYSAAERGFDMASRQLLGAVKAAPYGEAAFGQLGNGLAHTPLWALLPSKVTALFPPAPLKEEVICAPEEVDDDILFTEEPSSPRDPLDESSLSAEADQEALYEQGEKYFDLCDKNGDGSLTKSEIKNFAKKPAGMLLKQVFASGTKGWADLWNLIEMDEDGTFSKDAFASAYAQLNYSA
jgi:hypothetical protein